MEYWGCVFAAFRGMLFQLAVSPFNWINKVMEDVGDKVGCMLNAEASHDCMVQRRADQRDEDDH
jgi:hypothetical protein